MLISQLALFFFLLLFCATNGLSRGLQVRGSKEVLGRHLHIVLGLVKLRVVVAPLVVIFSRDRMVGTMFLRYHEEIVDCGKPERSAS